MSLISHRQKSTILSDVRVGKKVVSGKGCACADDEYVANVLLKIGLPYTAGMHANHSKDWSLNDLYLHASEEDDKLFPMLKTVIHLSSEKDKISDLKKVDRLISEHVDVVYPSIKSNEFPPEVFMTRHSKLENELIRKYSNRLISMYSKEDKATKVGTNILETAGYKSSGTHELIFGALVTGTALLVGAPIVLAAIPLIGIAGYNAYQKYDESKKNSNVITKSKTYITPLQLTLWEQNNGIPNDKLNNRGQKFIDPYAIDGGCWEARGMDNLMTLPKDGRVRIEYIHRNAQTSKPKVMPAADVMIACAGEFNSQAINKVGANLKERQKWWADQISKYARYTGNGFVIAFAELYASFLRYMPASWNTEFKRAISIANDEADQLKVTIISTVGYGLPYPLHVLDGEIADLNDLKNRNNFLNSNLKKSLVLPDSAKEVLRSWFAILISLINTDVDVQSAVSYIDNSDWGVKNLASDEQVYLVGVVFAKALNIDIVNFCTELWNRSKGWNRFKALCTNSHIPWLKTANGKLGTSGSSENGGFVYDQKYNLGKWEPAEEPFSNNCVSNARQLNYLDIILTAYEILEEKGFISKEENPVDKNAKLIKAALIK